MSERGSTMDAVLADLTGVLDPAHRADPYPYYARIREAGPVWVEPLSALVVAGYQDCEALIRDPGLSAERWRAGGSSGYELPPDAPSSARMAAFLSLDPPEHTRLRRLVSQAFTARTVARLEPRLVQLIDDLLDRAAERGSLDVVADFAYPLPIAVICQLLGVPVADEMLFRGWSSQLTKLIDGFQAMRPGDGGAPGWVRARIEICAYMEELVAYRQRRPGDDLISALLAAEDADGALTRDELVVSVVLLLIAGHETTVNLIANGLLALFRHPRYAAELLATPELAPAVVEETLRYDPPVQLAARMAPRDMEILGRPVRQHSLVYLLLAAAHRDPAVYPFPDRFDPDRPTPRHLAFGMGAHFCLGAPLARLEGRLALYRFFQRVLEPWLCQDPPVYREHVNLRGPATMPVTFAGVADRFLPWP